MRVYLAGRFARQTEIAAHADRLRRDLGWHITSRWLYERIPVPLTAWDTPEMAAHLVQTAHIDVEDLEGSDALVLFTEDPMVPHVRGGRHAEFGWSLARGLRLMLVGPRENVFHFLPRVEQYASVDALIATERAHMC